MEPQTHQNLLDSIERFPQSPGVYLMKNAQDVPLYIGKAINLKSRVKSYFFDTTPTGRISRYAAKVGPHRMDRDEQRIRGLDFRGQSH